MGNIDQKLNDYIWENLSFLEAIFSEKIYKILLRFKDKKDKESFTYTLEAVIEVDTELFEKLEIIYQDYNNGIKEELKLDEIYFKKAYSYFLNKEYEKAETFYKKTLKINPNHAKTYAGLGYMYSQNKENDLAIEYYSKAIKLNAKNLHIIHTNIGIIHQTNSDYDKAIEHFNKAIEIDSDDSIAYHNLGIISQNNREEDKAKEYFNKAIKCYEKFSKNNLNYDNFINLNNLKTSLNQAFFLDKRTSNLNLYINKINIQHFKQYENFSIDFSNKINIIIGQNSTGKTTLLQALTLGLLKENSSDTKKIDYDDYISKGQEKSEIIIYHNNNEEKKVKVLKEKREINENYFIPFVLAYGSNFFTSKTNEVKEVAQNLINHTVHRDFTSSIFMDYTNGFVNPIRLLEFLDLEKDESVPNVQKTFIETINSFLEGFELIATEDKNYYFQKENSSTKLSLEELSEGYRGNVLLITDMLIKILGVGYTPTTIEGIVLIDEFDKHLHPKWQSQLVAKLTKTFPKIQFIMTTHNPMSILDRNPDEITILKEINGQIMAVKGGGTKTIDISTIMLEYFGVKSTISESMQKKINRFNNLKVQTKLTTNEEKELTELEIFLSNTVASNFIYNRPYLQFLKFLKTHKDINFDSYEKLDESKREKLLEEFGDLFDD